jgi:hypothetical protein
MAKRSFDWLVSGLGLLLLAPVFLAVALWIKLESPGPVFFRQMRVGQFGRLFRIHKFRTMTLDAEARGLQITTGNDVRITRLGAFLRHWKIDELPQLIDVLLGRMSLVGPRPEVPRYVVHYPADIKDLVFSVRPGLTDSASIRYKDENDLLDGSADPEKIYIEEILPVKLGFYADYALNRSFLGDLKLIFATLKALTKSR